MLRGRERLLATAVVWAGMAITLNTMISAFTRFTADFTGLWPNMGLNFYSNGTMSQEQMDQYFAHWNEVMSNVQPLLDSAVAQVNSSISQQMASQSAPMIVLALALMLAATVSTVFIWRGAGGESAAMAENQTQAAQEKTKRRSRVDQFVEKLSDQELAELRARLAAEGSDGEVLRLDDLMGAAGAAAVSLRAADGFRPENRTSPHRKQVPTCLPSIMPSVRRVCGRLAAWMRSPSCPAPAWCISPG